MKIDKTVIKETEYIAVFVALFSVIMQAVFLCLGYWQYTVLLGNIWGIIIAIGNFFVMGLFVQKAVTQSEEEARKTVKTSQAVRFAALILLLVIGLIIPVFNSISVVLPLAFPSLAIYLRPLFDKNKK
ncbi:MAG: ATP synthase subunit I [Clostridia bacterium]|nr:ATP synthase subunit I [Clostridia bacterium]